MTCPERVMPACASSRFARPKSVMCGSSLDFIGVQPLLDAVARYLPSPLDRPPVEGTNPNPKKQGKPEVRKPSDDEPFCGLVFKIQSDQHGAVKRAFSHGQTNRLLAIVERVGRRRRDVRKLQARPKRDPASRRRRRGELHAPP